MPKPYTKKIKPKPAIMVFADDLYKFLSTYHWEYAEKEQFLFWLKSQFVFFSKQQNITLGDSINLELIKWTDKFYKLHKHQMPKQVKFRKQIEELYLTSLEIQL